MKKAFYLLIGLYLTCSTAFAGFTEYYNAGQQYLSQYQYSSAIVEFRKALRINYLDNSARIGLVNSYLARGTYFANNDKDWENAANDYRAALFYLKYYPTSQDVLNSAQAISNTAENLSQCLAMQKFNTSAPSRYQKAKTLRSDGNFAEAGYEFAQTLADSTLKKDSLEQIGDVMKVLGNDQKALEYYQKAVAGGQEDAKLRLKYARILDRMGQNDIAVEEYNFALSRCNNDPEILYALDRIYRQKMEQSPNDPEVMANLGAILQKQNKLDEALQYYTKAGELNPSNVTTRLNVGTLYQQKKSYDAAIAAYDSILVLYPNNVQANLYKAQCLAAMGRNIEATKSFQTVQSLDPTNKDVQAQIFETMKKTMTPTEMLTYLNQQAMTDNDKQGAIDDMYDYALSLHKQNKFDDAITFYKNVLRFKSDNPEVYINLAIAYDQKKDLAMATKTLQEAKLKFPTNKQIADNLNAFLQDAASDKIKKAADYYNSNNYQKALESYLAIIPATADSLEGAAACYKGLNNDAKALEFYKKAYDLSPNDSDLAYYLGVLYSEKEDWNTSKNYLKKAIALNKNNSKATDIYQTVVEQANIKLLDKAIAHYDKSEYPQAQKILNQIILEDSKNAYAYYYRGLISDAQKKYALALIDYKKVIQYSSDLTIVHYLIALDYDALLQYKNALINYKKYVSLTTETNEYKTYAQSRIKALKKYE